VRHLLQRMLEVDPAKRITLDQITQNDWFTMRVLNHPNSLHSKATAN